MKTHPQQEKLSAYIDDMLDVGQMCDLAYHLSVCAVCHADYASLRETRDMLSQLSAPPALPRDFWSNAYRQVRVSDGARRISVSPVEQLRLGLAGTQRRWAAGAAAIALLGAVLAGPIINSERHLSAYTSGTAAVVPPDTVDLSTLVWDHTQSAAAQPLADSDRQAMLSADVDNGSANGDSEAEASGNGGFSGDATP